MKTHPILTIVPSGVHAGDVWVPLDPAAWEATMCAGLAPIRREIAEAIERAGLRGKKIKVRYRSLDAAVELLTLPLSARDARDAAMLRLREALGGCGVRCSTTMCAVPTPGRSGSTTLLVAADKSAVVDQVAEVVSSAGATPELVLPVRASHLRSAVGAVFAAPKARATAVLWIDRHGTAIAGGADGTCTFARLLSTALDLFAEAIQRASRETGAYDFATALDRLQTRGIPVRGEMFDAAVGLDGNHVLPMLQPALQRLAIEVKQTLRFGLPEGECNRVEVTIAGPGASIPGLAEALTGLVETEVRPIKPEHERQRLRWEQRLTLGITPSLIEAGRTRRSLVTATLSGAVVAAAAIFADARWSASELHRIQSQIDRNEAALVAAKRVQAIEDRLDALNTHIVQMDTLMRTTVDDPPRWSAVLALLTKLELPGLRISELNASGNQEGSILTAKGLIPAADSGPSAVTRIVDRLSQNPLISRVRVGSTRLADEPEGRVVHFSISLTLKPLPAESVIRVAEGSRR